MWRGARALWLGLMVCERSYGYRINQSRKHRPARLPDAPKRAMLYRERLTIPAPGFRTRMGTYQSMPKDYTGSVQRDIVRARLQVQLQLRDLNRDGLERFG